MDREQRITYINSQILACQIEMQAMIADNQHRLSCGKGIAYGEEDFMRLFDRYPIGNDDVITELCGEGW